MCIRDRAKAYGLMKEVLSVGMPALYLLYFPIVFLIETWLPDYQASIEMFLYLIPICVFEGKMQMVFTTYFKVLREEKTLLWVNLLGVGISALGSVVGLIFLGSVEVALVMLASQHKSQRDNQEKGKIRGVQQVSKHKNKG